MRPRHCLAVIVSSLLLPLAMTGCAPSMTIQKAYPGETLAPGQLAILELHTGACGTDAITLEVDGAPYGNGCRAALALAPGPHTVRATGGVIPGFRCGPEGVIGVPAASAGDPAELAFEASAGVTYALDLSVIGGGSTTIVINDERSYLLSLEIRQKDATTAVAKGMVLYTCGASE